MPESIWEHELNCASLLHASSQESCAMRFVRAGMTRGHAICCHVKLTRSGILRAMY